MSKITGQASSGGLLLEVIGVIFCFLIHHRVQLMKKTYRYFLCSSLLILWFAPFDCRAQEKGPCEQPRFGEDAGSLYKMMSALAAKPGSDVLVFCDEDRYAFDADGKSVHTSYIVYKVLTQKGSENWDQVSWGWEPWHETKPELKARVIPESGAAHWLDAKTVSDSPASDDEDNVYSDRRVVRAPLPAIAPGVVVEQEIVTKESAPLFGAGTVTNAYFGRRVPVQETRLILQHPATLPMQYRIKLLPAIKEERSESGGMVKVSLVQGPMDALEDAEPYLPSSETAFPRVSFSTGKSWQEIAKTYGEIVDKQTASADVKGFVAGVTKGKASREDKIRAIVQYLSREVRYTGIEFDESAIVPHSPAETLKQKYGDCKDKSTLLVTMLRTAGIPAYVALLNAGNRQDIDEELPGLGTFDHAIVFVPGKPEYWIDATDDYARLGELPQADQGRLALVASAEESGLRKTPESSAQENTIAEKREFTLAENGPAHIVETTEPKGIFESQFRSYYADKENKDARQTLTDYVKAEYLTENLDGMERSDPKDLSRQFELKAVVNKGKRGFTDMDSAVVAIRLDSLFSRLPDELQQREDESKKKNGDGSDKPKKPRTADYQLPTAYSEEWQYTIEAPMGFQPKALPEAKKLAVGPAQLAYEFSKEADGTVRGVVRFNTEKRRISAAEAKEMRDKVVQLREGEPLLIYFEPVAQALLDQGKIKESLEEIRGLIAAHPKEALHHLQMARALLAAGQGEAAREEARVATELEPNSELGEKIAADILSYDMVGRKYRIGSDYTGAEAAYRKAESLDADDKEVKGNLALLLEHNPEGERYGAGARLKEAVSEYQKLKEQDLSEIGLKNNPAFAMFYAGETAEAKAYGEKLNPQLTGLIVAAIALSKGAQEAITEARKRTENEAGMKSVLSTAGNMVMRMRQYGIAADLLEAGANGNNASNTLALASMLRTTKRRETLRYGNDPSGLGMKIFVDTFSGTMTKDEMIAMSSRNARIVMQRQGEEEFKKTLQASRQVRNTFQKLGLPVDAMIDVVLGRIEFKTEGDDANGYRATIRMPGTNNLTEFFVKEDGQYKILDTGEHPNSIGLEALDRVKAGNYAGARVLLDWVRERQTIAGGDDPLAGYSFPRMWTKGQEGDAEKIRLAVGALLAETKETAKEGVEILEPSLTNAKDETTRTNIELSLVLGYGNLEQYDKMLQEASKLAKSYPDSKRVFLDEETALRNLGEFAEADALANEKVKKDDNDMEARRALVFNAVAAGDYSAARELGIAIDQIGKAEASDLNGIAWNSLFTGKTDASDLDYIRRATQLAQNDAGILHTLGCVYAELGKTKEAREVLIQAMDLLALDEPDGNYWYAFGRIAEQYGLKEAAIADYRRVEKPKNTLMIPGSSYLLAQRRLAALGATTGKGSRAKD